MTTIITNKESIFTNLIEEYLGLPVALEVYSKSQDSKPQDSRGPRKPKGKSKPQKVELVALLEPCKKKNGRKARPPARSSNVLYLQF